MMQKLVKTIVFTAISLFLFACKTVTTLDQPQGFATYSTAASFKAISPDRVLYRVRVEDNNPFANLDFWKTALKNRMLDAGYHFVSDSSIKSQNNPGYLLELAAPVGNIDYMYLVALYLQDRSIVIIESAGEVNDYKSQREQIIAAISKIDVKTAVTLRN